MDQNQMNPNPNPPVIVSIDSSIPPPRKQQPAVASSLSMKRSPSSLAAAPRNQQRAVASPAARPSTPNGNVNNPPGNKQSEAFRQYGHVIPSSDTIYEAAKSGDLSIFNNPAPRGSSYHLQLQNALFNYRTDAESLSNIICVAASFGRLGFIQKAFDYLSPFYICFLICQQDKNGENSLHIATTYEKYEVTQCLVSTYKRFSPISQEEEEEEQQQQQQQQQSSPTEEQRLHLTANMLDMAGEVDLEIPPWKAFDNLGYTPLLNSLVTGDEVSALYLLKLDPEGVYAIEGPLYLAIQNKCNQVAQNILDSGSNYCITGLSGQNPLHVVSNGQEHITRTLLEKHPDLLEENELPVLHEWASSKVSLEPFKILFEKITTSIDSSNNSTSATDTANWKERIKKWICHQTPIGNPLHVAASCGHQEIAKLLADTWKQLKSPIDEESQLWTSQNDDGDTPLHMALKNGHEELALYVLQLDAQILKNTVNKNKESPLFLAITGGCHKVVKSILSGGADTYANDCGQDSEKTILHFASKCKEDDGKLLVVQNRQLLKRNRRLLAKEEENSELQEEEGEEKEEENSELPEEENSETVVTVDGDDEEVTDEEPEEVVDKEPLIIAAKEGKAWLIETLLQTDKSVIVAAPTAWIEACENGHFAAIEAFVKHGHDGEEYSDFTNLCEKVKDSPLHHIEKGNLDQYNAFLKNEVISGFINLKDEWHCTPLHEAIRRSDIHLVEALLKTPTRKFTIKDYYGDTALKLLSSKCQTSEDWANMCRRCQINPKLKTQYLAHITDPHLLAEMRSTISVVAALLATITFAAGFTLPGGFNSDDGTAILANRAVFIVFLISDTYAMCCSMVVMFCMIWAMVFEDIDKTRVVMDSCVSILQQALCGTLVAFAAGVYTVIAEKVLWVTILVCVMCALVVPLAGMKSLIYKLLDKWVADSDDN